MPLELYVFVHFGTPIFFLAECSLNLKIRHNLPQIGNVGQVLDGIKHVLNTWTLNEGKRGLFLTQKYFQ